MEGGQLWPRRWGAGRSSRRPQATCNPIWSHWPHLHPGWRPDLQPPTPPGCLACCPRLHPQSAYLAVHQLQANHGSFWGGALGRSYPRFRDPAPQGSRPAGTSALSSGVPQPAEAEPGS